MNLSYKIKIKLKNNQRKLTHDINYHIFWSAGDCDRDGSECEWEVINFVQTYLYDSRRLSFFYVEAWQHLVYM